MREIEIKFSVRDFRDILQRLQHLGAHLEYEGVEQSWFFDTPKEELRKRGHMLRLRTMDGAGYTLTLKTKPEEEDSKYKIRHEYELGIDNVRTAFSILKRLGYRERARYKKHRQHWVLEGAYIELDTLKGRRFVEIEAPKKRIDELAPILGLDWGQATRKGYVTIMRELEKPGKK